jgi:hypothetical protein
VPPEEGRAGDIRLLAVELPRDPAAGRAAPVVLWWRREGREAQWPVQVHLRWTALDAGADPKPVRILHRWLFDPQGPAGRHREAISPFSGAWPAIFWPLGIPLADTVEVHLPAFLVPGSYAVSARVLAEPLMERVGVGDLWGDDRWQGSWLDTVVVGAAGSSEIR